jgi:hypothetical protein
MELISLKPPHWKLNTMINNYYSQFINLHVLFIIKNTISIPNTEQLLNAANVVINLPDVKQNLINHNVPVNNITGLIIAYIAFNMLNFL